MISKQNRIGYKSIKFANWFLGCMTETKNSSDQFFVMLKGEEKFDIFQLGGSLVSVGQ